MEESLNIETKYYLEEVDVSEVSSQRSLSPLPLTGSHENAGDGTYKFLNTFNELYSKFLCNKIC